MRTSKGGRGRALSWKQIIARICRFYPGYTHETCLDMTKGQVLGLHWEMDRIKASEQYDLLNLLLTARPGVDPEELLDSLKIRIDPPDAEKDDIGLSGFEQLKAMLSGKDKLKGR